MKRDATEKLGRATEGRGKAMIAAISDASEKISEVVHGIATE